MALKFGLNAKAYYNNGTYDVPAWVEMSNCQDVTLNLEKTSSNVTTRGAGGWELNAAVLKKATVDFKMMWDTEDASFTKVSDAYFNNNSIEFAFMDGDISVAGAKGLRATMDVFTFNRNEPLTEAMTVDVNVMPTYSADHAPAWYTVSS